MNWHTFGYNFTPELQRAMRYAVEESIRKCAQSAGGGKSAEMANMAVERFISKIQHHTGRTVDRGDKLLAAHAKDLLASLQAVVAQINDYERVNNLGPSPGRTECWDCVARAKEVIAKATA